MIMSEKVTVAFQGVPGAFSEDAAFRYFGNGIEPIPCAEFNEVFNRISRGEDDFGIVPVENTLEGSVSRVNALLLENDLTVVGEEIIQVVHCLIGHPGASQGDVRKVYSHPQALAQCRNFLEKHPDWEKIPAYDTAGAVKQIKERGLKDEGAVASSRAASAYDMKVLKEGIQDSDRNYTRFFVLEKRASFLEEGDKTSLIFATKDLPGALHHCLGAFAERGVNMTKLESRPRRDRFWEYVFFLDIDGHADDEIISKALADLVRRAAFVKVLGSYKGAERPYEK
jgi:chorismate mutase/prephenate dehydratase